MLRMIIHKEYDYYVYSELDKSNERFLRKQENTDKSKDFMWKEEHETKETQTKEQQPDLFTSVDEEQSELPF